jgi:hypothetical protein
MYPASRGWQALLRFLTLVSGTNIQRTLALDDSLVRVRATAFPIPRLHCWSKSAGFIGGTKPLPLGRGGSADCR